MAERSLGYIVPAGMGPQSATINMPVLTNGQAYMATAYRVQHMPGNTGKVWIGDSTLEPSTGTGVIGYLPELANADAKPYDSQATWGPISNLIDMATVFIDTENPTDGAIVIYMEA